MTKPIGVFDSGLGGLTVLRELKRQLPTQSFIYLGDNARTPYGTKSEETIKRYSLECATYLKSQHVQAIVVACNTASAIALDDLKNSFSLPVIGTIDPAVDAALKTTQNNRVGIIGTDATVASNAYQKALYARAPEVEVFVRACPLLVPLVESGMLHGHIVESVIEHYLSELRALDIDTLILGCTHYPLLSAEIAAFVGDKMILVDCAEAIAFKVKELDLAFPAAKSSGITHYFVTDPVGRFNFIAKEFLGGEDILAQIISLG